MVNLDSTWASSAFLALRWLPEPDRGWTEGFVPEWPAIGTMNQTPVGSASEIDAALRQRLLADSAEGRTGILLSGGIDSAILARMLPAGTSAFCIRYSAPGAVDESTMARIYAELCDLDLEVLDVTWDDHVALSGALMRHKKAPLHPVEVGLYVAARAAADRGLETLVVGNGADSTFGGMDKLLAKEWLFDEFAARYTFVEPASALRDPVSMRGEFEKYRTGEGIDVPRFLKRTHGLGIVQAFDNALGAAGTRAIAPYEHVKLSGELDLARVRAGEPKYLLQELFRNLYPTLDPPRKIPFARPMDVWLKDWRGPGNRVFRSDLDIESFDGEQKWLLWVLDAFLDLVEAES